MKSPHVLSSRISAVAVVVTSLAASADLKAANISAQWNFDDVANTGSSVANVGGFVGTFNGVADRSIGGGGVTGGTGDYSLDLRALGGTIDGAMTVDSAEFLGALNGVTGSQAISLTYWQFLNSTPNSTSFWGTSLSSNAGGRGLNAHSPWSNGDAYFDTSGCCDAGTQRTTGPLGATPGQWQLMAMTFEGTGANDGIRSIYRRDLTGASTLIAQTAGGLNLVTDITQFIVGNDRNYTSGMDARLDNFTIWNGALTQQEIDTVAVPEPGCAVLIGCGAMLGLLRRPRAKRP